jgi:hypothetical protein
VDYLHLWELIS